MQRKGYQYRRMENFESKPASTECVRGKVISIGEWKTLTPNPHLLSVLAMQRKGYQYRRMENSESKPASTECVSHAGERLSV